MATLAEQVQGERMARIVLSMIAEPNDPITGYVLARHGGVETLTYPLDRPDRRLAESIQHGRSDRSA